MTEANTSDSNSTLPDETPANPHCGVEGLLKFFVVIQLYIAPTIFAVVSCTLIKDLCSVQKINLSFLVTGVVDWGLDAYLVWKWIQVARMLRDIRPGAVQAAKKWLLISLGYSLLIGVIYSLAWDAHDFRSMVTNPVAFTIWYAYFCRSKRVKATYPDWNQKK